MTDEEILAALRNAVRDEKAMVNGSAEDVAPLSGDALARIKARAKVAMKAKPRAKVTSIATRRAAMFGVIAAAALVLLWIARPAPSVVSEYEIAFMGGEVAMRGDDTTPVPRLKRGSRVEIVLRPDRKVEAPVAMRAVLVRGNEVRGWTPPTETSADGTIRIVGKAGELFPGIDGTWDVKIAVGSADALPTTFDAIAGATSPRGWRLVQKRFVMEAD
jgi:hypothetical protein